MDKPKSILIYEIECELRLVENTLASIKKKAEYGKMFSGDNDHKEESDYYEFLYETEKDEKEKRIKILKRKIKELQK
jgi:hypothetical protein